MKASLNSLASNRSPISYVSPNLLELNALYQAARDNDMTSCAVWWRIIDEMGVGSEFRLELDHLSRRNACDTNQDIGSLEFLVHDGTAQMAVNLLPFFQHIVLKCGRIGVIVVFRTDKESPWSQERTNIKARQVVAQGKSGGTLILKHYPAQTLDATSLVNVTGAGDSLVGSLLASLLQKPGSFQNLESLDQVITWAQKVCDYTRWYLYALLILRQGCLCNFAKPISSIATPTYYIYVMLRNVAQVPTKMKYSFQSEDSRGPTATCSRARRSFSFSAAIATRCFSFARFS